MFDRLMGADSYCGAVFLHCNIYVDQRTNSRDTLFEKAHKYAVGGVCGNADIKCCIAQNHRVLLYELVLDPRRRLGMR